MAEKKDRNEEGKEKAESARKKRGRGQATPKKRSRNHLLRRLSRRISRLGGRSDGH
jgi:hypothetical protein